MRIAVVVCTRNRAGSLERVLESFIAMEVPQEVACSFLIVDNGSTDTTCSVLERFANKLRMHLIYEPQPGLSIARNRALAEAQTDYIISLTTM